LLVKGEPGTGKTMLAEEVAEALGVELLQWHIKSTTKAQQGLYEYDAVSRLRDSQLGEERVKDIHNYIIKVVLWQAFTAEKPVALLIDEIDRADEPFEAFLLEYLGEYQVSIPELGTITAQSPPVTILTSNRTRDLNDAVKRRCLYHWMDYPERDQELAILRAQVPQASQTLAEQVAQFVSRLRHQPFSNAFQRGPGIAESVEWAKALVALNTLQLDPEVIHDTAGILFKQREDLAALQPLISDLLAPEAAI
jgi:MoxR-like ATPase